MSNQFKIEYIDIDVLKLSEYNPRKHSPEMLEQLKRSIVEFDMPLPIIANKAEARSNVVIGGHARIKVAKELGLTTVPVVFVDIPDLEKEKALNLKLNKVVGEWDLDLLKEFDESLLIETGFTSEDIDNIFPVEENVEQFDLEKELLKLKIDKITVAKGDVYDLDGSRLMCGDSTIEDNMLRLMGDHRADHVNCDPPYRLDYLHGKSRNGKPTEGFGAKRDRKYLETDELPLDFTEKWMNNVALVAKDDFSIIVYENWRNIREIWGEMEKHWKVRNMIVWHLANRNQGYAGIHKFFSKHDIAMVGTSENHNNVNIEDEELLFDNEYKTALFAIQGKPQWESYGKGKQYCPTDFIEHNAADEKSSGQGIIFGTKPIEILIPYIKVLTKRDELVLEPFGGSGSTLIASVKLGRRCFVMEKSPVYAEVIMNRWERETGKKRKKLE